MSLCVCFQNDNELLIGADTAVSMRRDGEIYRSKTEIQKLIPIDNMLIFTCGHIGIISAVLAEFQRKSVRTVQVLGQVMAKHYAEFVPKPLLIDDGDKEEPLAFLVAEYNGSGVVTYTLNPTNGFEPVKHVATPDNTLRHAGGMGSTRAMALIDELGQRGDMNGFEMMIETFTRLSGKYIGGHLTLAKVSQRGIEFFQPLPIREKLSVKMYEDYYNGDTPITSAIGSEIKTANNGIFPRVELSSAGNLVGAYYNAGNSIQITPNYAGAPAIEFYTAGNLAGRIHTLMGKLEIEGNGSITISGGPGGNVNLGGTINVDGWTRVKYGSRTLQDELDQLNDSVESVRLNAAARGISTGLAGSHNHGIAEGTRLAIWGPNNTVAGYVTWSPAPTHSHQQN